MKYDFKNKNIIVTGGTEGFGKNIIENLINNGANISFCARNLEQIDKMQKFFNRLKKNNQTIISSRTDISQKEEVERFIKFTRKKFSSIDVLINNAGVYGPIGPIDTVSWDEWVYALNINLIGSILMIRSLIPTFKAQKISKIIQISGGGATNPMPNFSSYAVSKTGIVRFVETMSYELKNYNTYINAVAPGALNTKMLDKVLESDPKKVGDEFYNRSVEQKETGGAGFQKGIDLINFLISDAGDKITGKLISAQWDNFEMWADNIEKVSESDVYTLRRIVGKDRKLDWGDK